MLNEFNLHLQYHKELNPVIWNTNEKINPAVRSALLKFAEAWAQTAGISPEIITDVLFTGGNANYNYTEKSDLDVHLIIDRNLMASEMHVTRDFLDNFLADKKVLWTLSNKKSKILGYPIEPYAQDKEESIPKGQGVYSLLHDHWIQAPVNMDLNFTNDVFLKKKVKNFARSINHLIVSGASLTDIKKLKTQITSSRKSSISKDGEFAFDNLVFKALRNRGDLDRLDRYVSFLKRKEIGLDK